MVLTHSAGVEVCYGDFCSNQTKQERLENIPWLANHGCHRSLDINMHTSGLTTLSGINNSKSRWCVMMCKNDVTESQCDLDLVILMCVTLSVFQLSAARKASTSVQRPPAPAKPITWLKKTENMDRPNNMRVLLNTSSSCRETDRETEHVKTIKLRLFFLLDLIWA